MRWQGPFETPNVAGIEMASLCLVSIAMYALFQTRSHTGGRLWLLFATACCALLSFGLLVLSGSRASAASFLVGILALGVMRKIKLKLLIACLTLLIVAVAVSDNRSRYYPATHASDQSIQHRYQLWSSTFALIGDHPVFGVGRNELMGILNTWYLPPSIKGVFGTALNEPLTICASWGIPALLCYLSLISWLLATGFINGSKGCSLATFGTLILLTHIVGGQFQGHIFAWWSIQLGWCIGSLLIVISALKTKIYPDLHWRESGAILAIFIGLFAAAFIAVPTNCSWKTVYLDGSVIAIPRKTDLSGVTVAVGVDEVPRPALLRWIDFYQNKGHALILVNSIPSPAWWMKLEYWSKRHAGCYPRVLGAWDSGVGLWESWISGSTGNAVVCIYDPHGTPQSAVGKALHQRGPIFFQCARGAPFIDRDFIAGFVRSNSNHATYTIHDGTNATWWHNID